MFEKWKADVLGNATMCNTLRKKLDSKQDTLTVLTLSHVGSTFAILVIGLLAASVSFSSELGLKKCFGGGPSARNETVLLGYKVVQVHNSPEEPASCTLTEVQ